MAKVKVSAKKAPKLDREDVREMKAGTYSVKEEKAENKKGKKKK